MSRSWSHSLFGCCSPVGLCCEATFVPCCVAGKNHHRIKHGSTEGYSCCNAWCCGWTALCCVGHFEFILNCVDRGNLNDKHDLEGGACGSCLKAWCCTCCDLIQVSKELDTIEEKKPFNQGYQTQAGMMAQPRN